MYKVTVRSAITLEALWIKCFNCENKAEEYAGKHFDADGKKGRCLTATWELI